MKILLFLFSTIFLIYSKSISAQSKAETDSYFDAAFSGNFLKAKQNLIDLKRNNPNSLKILLIVSNYYSLMYETTGSEEKYYILCKKYADEAVKRLNSKKEMTNEDIFRIISAKSILLKINVQKKNYWKVATNMQTVIKYFEYASKHDQDDKLKLISGMYNYYIETAKEDYPIIYPLLLFYPSGNKSKGLKLLKECTNSSDKNTRIRSLLQLALIYYRDEKDIKTAKSYFNILLAIYPENLIWQTEYYTALKKYNLKADYKLRQQIIKNKLIKNTFLSKKQKKYFYNKAELPLP